MRPLEVVRFGYGFTELFFPAVVSQLVLGHRPDSKTRVVLRILGGRHMIQALVLFGRPRSWHRIGAAVDIVHAGTAATLAATDQRRRVPASVNAALALLFGVGELG